MISVPLRRLGINIHNDLIETIYNQTGGLPELIQIYCAAIVKFHSDKKKSPDSTELFKKVADSEEF